VLVAIGRRSPAFVIGKTVLARRAPGLISRTKACAAFEAALPFFAAILPNTGKTVMAWKTPKIVEVPVGMEINMYACAARK
jgi:coenzyme PQQ precursor peptide PqqA